MAHTGQIVKHAQFLKCRPSFPESWALTPQERGRPLRASLFASAACSLRSNGALLPAFFLAPHALSLLLASARKVTFSHASGLANAYPYFSRMSDLTGFSSRKETTSFLKSWCFIRLGWCRCGLCGRCFRCILPRGIRNIWRFALLFASRCRGDDVVGATD
jgi:hypothetical protein